MKYDVEIPKSILFTLFRALLILLALVGMEVIGYYNSPLGENGRPLLLSPRLAEITRYQHRALRWAGELQEIQTGLRALLENQSADLLAQDREANSLYGRLLNLQEEVDSISAPPTLETLHESQQTAVEGYATAAYQVMAWISEPTEENYTKAQEAVSTASSALDIVKQNPWMQGEP
jgi:hypothetical protein